MVNSQGQSREGEEDGLDGQSRKTLEDRVTFLLSPTDNKGANCAKVWVKNSLCKHKGTGVGQTWHFCGRKGKEVDTSGAGEQ